MTMFIDCALWVCGIIAAVCIVLMIILAAIKGLEGE